MSRRVPYVGHGAEGCRRSAEIDRAELDAMPTGPHQPGWTSCTPGQRALRQASAEAWDQLAAELDAR